jgi:hypothetical protein
MRREDGLDITLEPNVVGVSINVHACGAVADHSIHNNSPQEGRVTKHFFGLWKWVGREWQRGDSRPV